jgi:peptidyl-dipeptidase Dcp
VTNPLLSDWTAPFELPPFREIAAADFGPAFDTALAEDRADVDAIAASSEAPTFENTIAALERSGETLTRVASVFFNLAGAHTNPDIQALERELAPRLAAHANETTMNAALFARIEDLHIRRENLPLTGEQLRVLEKTYDGFVRAGAKLEGANKERLGEIKQRLATLGTAFSQNVLADESAFAMPLKAPDDLEGLPDFVIEAAAAAAKERGSDATHVVTLSRSLIEPFLTFSARRDLREKAFHAWTHRGANGDANDNREIVAEILRLRQERAALLGYETFAAYKLANTMAKTPEAVRALLEDVWRPAVARARQEATDLGALAASQGENSRIAAWDWRYYAEQLRSTRYNLDEAALKPYFTLDRMIEAAFDVANRLFGLSFKPLDGVSFYHPDVRGWEVTGRDGQHVGVFLGDYFARTSKRSGAWMSAFRGQNNLDRRVRPIIVNVCNFAKAADGKPTLLSFDDARTLFHEFGHALHGLLSNVTYPSIAGTSVARDFVELPSQLYEHWLETDEVMTRFARHHETGAPLPRDLREKLKAARNFNQGFATVEYLSSALVDLAFHTDPDAQSTDPMTFQTGVLKQIDMPEEIVMRHATPHFLHVFAGDGYSAGYYSYMWSEVLDADAFKAFEETGNVFDAAMAEKLAGFIYSAGASRDETEAYVAFRGRMPSVSGLLEKRGLV